MRLNYMSNLQVKVDLKFSRVYEFIIAGINRSGYAVN